MNLHPDCEENGCQCAAARGPIAQCMRECAYKVENICETCRYFSDTVAKWRGNGQTVQALCLHKDSPYYMHYKPSYGTCVHFHAGAPIDVRHQP